MTDNDEFNDFDERWDPYYLTVREIRALGWVKWANEHAERMREPGVIESASLYECRALWTSIHRKERFCEGALAAATRVGVIDRLKTRIDQLLAEEDSA